jgi:hypothetical protein
MNHFVEISLIAVVMVSIPVLILITVIVYGIRDTCIFLKTGRWPEWKNLGKARMVFKREVGDYYELIEQNLFVNLNNKNGQQMWEIVETRGPLIWMPPIQHTKLVVKDSVTIDEEGVAHYVATKDPIEI